jgi:hypothetical protein
LQPRQEVQDQADQDSFMVVGVIRTAILRQGLPAVGVQARQVVLERLE